jgi:hypothetical protein
LLIVAALDDLEPVHLRVMELLEQPADPENPDQGWLDSMIEEQIVGVSRVGCQGALGGLVRHGLVAIKGAFGGNIYVLSDFGQALMAVMRQVAATMPSRNS